MGIGAKLLRQIFQLFFEFGPSTCTAHRPIHTQAQGDLLELFAMLVFAVINGMDKLMNKRVEDLDGLMQSGGNEDLILTIGAATLRPTLPDVMASGASTGKPTGNHHICGYDMVFR
jgi:hypothetical protein